MGIKLTKHLLKRLSKPKADRLIDLEQLDLDEFDEEYFDDEKRYFFSALLAIGTAYLAAICRHFTGN